MAGRNRGDPPVDPHYEWMRNMMEMQQKMMQDMLHYQQHERQPQPNVPQLDDPNRLYSLFYKRNPPTFKGGANVMGAQYWLDEVEKIFRSLHCTDEDKVALATQLLKEEADVWWRNAHALMEVQGTPMTWENFRNLFLGQFFPAAARSEKEAEFLRLRQFDMTVGQYSAKFEELSQFYRLARYAPNDEWKMDRYKEGLREDIAQSLSSFACNNYAALVQQTYVVERDLKRLYASKKDYGHSKRNFGSSSSPTGPRGNINKGKQAQKFDYPRARNCPKCGRAHGGECKLGPVQCFYCKKYGHYASDCPEKKKDQGKSAAPTGGRVYTLDAKNVKPSDNGNK